MGKIKKLFCLLLSLTFAFTNYSFISAKDNEIIEAAEDLLSSALLHEELFNISNKLEKEVYISNPIKHYFKDAEGEYVLFDQNEYYLLYTQEEYIGSIVASYENNQLVSTSFNTILSNLFNELEIINDKFILVVQNGQYSLNIVESTLNVPENTIFTLTKMDTLNTQTSKIQPRSSGRVLNMPYVEQEDGFNTCWACAALSFGWFFYPNKCAKWDAIDVCSVSEGTPYGGTIIHTKDFLTDYFQINTTRITQVLSKGTIINHINNSRPIIVGYKPSTGMGHIVILAGYEANTENSTLKYYFRDSMSTTYTIVRSTTSPTTYPYAGTTNMNWTEALYKS